MGGSEPRQAPLWHRFVYGGVAEALTVCVTHPMDVMKVRLQLTGEGDKTSRSLTRHDFMRAGRKLALEEGRRGLYAGITASWLRQLVFSGLRHGLFGVFDRKWREERGGTSLGGRLTCAVSAGLIGAVVANPCDCVLIRMQSDGFWPPADRRNYRHVFDGLSRVAREEGVRVLWRGTGPTALRAALVTASQIGTYEEMKSRLLAAGYNDGFPLHISCAMSSATVACLVTSPVDVVKTRIMNMQRQGKTYSGPIDVMVQTAKTEGPRAFYKGLSATFLRLWPHTVLLFLWQERLAALLLEHA